MALKYRNKITVVDGIKFRSKREARRYGELKLLERAGEIKDLELQPEFTFLLRGGKMLRTARLGKPRKYIADFSYKEKDRKTKGGVVWREIVEDCKGMRTELYKWKRDLMRDLNGIVIRET